MTEVLRKAETLHYSNEIISKSNDSKATWNYINNLLKTNTFWRYHYLVIYQNLILLMILLVIGSKLSNIISNNSTYDSFKYLDTQVNSIYFISKYIYKYPTCVGELNHLISHTKNKYRTDSTELNMRLII